MKKRLNIWGATLASSVRGWRGSFKKAQPLQDRDHITLSLYEFEGCPFCRLVREAICELQLDVIIYPCPKDGRRFRPMAHALAGGKATFPFLVDTRADGQEVRLSESRDIIEYLWTTYAGQSAPTRLPGVTVATSMLASTIRGNKGTRAKTSIRQPERFLELYSFESSPFCRIVRERLCEMEIPYILRSAPKEQWEDVGLANARLTWGEYEPVPGDRRDAIQSEGRRVQFPTLIDPNQVAEGEQQEVVYETRRILKHLQQHYNKV